VGLARIHYRKVSYSDLSTSEAGGDVMGIMSERVRVVFDEVVEISLGTLAVVGGTGVVVGIWSLVVGLVRVVGAG
jgi:hypothetical protein